MSGGIAAYKSVYLLRELQQQGAEVRVVMTPSATRFVGTETFAALSRNEVPVHVFNDEGNGDISTSWSRISTGLNGLIDDCGPMHSPYAGRSGSWFFSDNMLLTYGTCRPVPLTALPYHGWRNVPVPPRCSAIYPGLRIGFSCAPTRLAGTWLPGSMIRADYLKRPSILDFARGLLHDHP